MAYYGRRRGSEQMFFEMVDVLASAKKRGQWSTVHSVMLIGMILMFLGLIGFVGSILLLLLTKGRDASNIIMCFGVAFVGVVIAIPSYFIARMKQ